MLSGAKACKSSRSRQELSNEYLLAKFGYDTAENEPLKAHFICQPWDFIFTEPPRPQAAADREARILRGCPPATRLASFSIVLLYQSRLSLSISDRAIRSRLYSLWSAVMWNGYLRRCGSSVEVLYRSTTRGRPRVTRA